MNKTELNRVLDDMKPNRISKSVERQLYDKAIEKWGAEAQIGMMIEECAELTLAISHLGRKRGSVIDIIEEMVDVEIMLKQMEIVFKKLNPELQKNFDEVYRVIRDEKLARLRDMLEKDGVKIIDDKHAVRDAQ